MENSNNSNITENSFTTFNREQKSLDKIHAQIRVILESHAKTTTAIMELWSMLGEATKSPIIESSSNDDNNNYYDRFANASKSEISENEESTENALIPERHYAEGRTRSNFYHLRKDDDSRMTTDTTKSKHSASVNHHRKRGRSSKVVGSSKSSPYTTTNPNKRNVSAMLNPETVVNQQLLDDFNACFNRRLAQGSVSQTKIAQEISKFVKDETFHVHQVDVSNMCKGKLPASFKHEALRNWISAQNAEPIVLIQQEREQDAQDDQQETYTANTANITRDDLDDEIIENN
ncbi:9759_t:CDS:2 [Ambispora leptoticha]|uniref:9759_t:CDS:1 n=1 Tax=Ambispora leptoticha TaxID=144679 RepID=A0A9N9CGE6_9GLOM|nr:9759_t:CDS:2 [Ambispora leptoticha]